MKTRIFRTKSIEFKYDTLKQIYFDDNILISTDDDFYREYTVDQSPITIRPNIGFYMRSIDKNYMEVDVVDILLLDDLPENYNESSGGISGDFIKDISIEDNKIIITNSKDEIEENILTNEPDKTSSPIITNITVYTNTKVKLSVPNFNKDILYNTNSDLIEIKPDGIYIKPININTYMETFEVSIFATEQGKIISNPTYFTITVINLEKQVTDNGFDFIKGRIFTIDNIKPEDIVSYNGFDIDLS